MEEQVGRGVLRSEDQVMADGGSLEHVSLLLIQVSTIICSHPPQTIVATKFCMLAGTATTSLTEFITKMLNPYATLSTASSRG